MNELIADQASGLRRLFAGLRAPQLVCLAANSPLHGRAGVLSLRDAFDRQGASARFENDQPCLGEAIRLFDDPEILRQKTTTGAQVVVLVHGRAGPAGLPEIYQSIKSVAARCRVDHYGVLLDGMVPPELAERCRQNLATAVERFVGVRIGLWASCAESGAFDEAARTGLSVHSVDQVSSAARAFDCLATAVLGLTSPPAPVRPH